MGSQGRTTGPLADGLRRALLLYAPIWAVSLGWCFARADGYDGLTVLGWMPGTAAMGLTAWYLYRPSRSPQLGSAGRRFWRWLAVAALLITPSTGPTTVARISGSRSGPLLTVAVALLVIALLIVLVALLRLPVRRRSSGDWFRLGLDAATVLVCAATFLWHFVLSALIGTNVDMRTVLGLLLLCVVCLLAVLAVVKLILAGTDAVDAAALRTLAVVVLAGALGSAISPMLAGPRLAGVSNVMTTLNATIASVAAIVQWARAGSAGTARAARRKGYSVLPYLAVAAIEGLLIDVTLRPGDRAAVGVVVGAVAATGIVALRQFLAFRDNVALVRSLREHQRLLREQATHDALTGLPNRALFNETLQAAFAPGRPAKLTAFLIDLDDFKTVNDTLGHEVGDGLLIEVGRRLRLAVRPGDLVARLGGDEFAVLLPGTAGPQVIDLATRIFARLDPPVVTHGHHLAVAASVGIAERDAADDPQSLLRHADIAMYAAKRNGKGNYARYASDFATGGLPA